MSNIQAISYEDIVSVSPSDTVVQFGTKPAAAFMAAVGGTITITTARNTKQQITINAGVIYPIAIKQVWSTGTAASSIVGLMALPYLGVQ